MTFLKFIRNLFDNQSYTTLDYPFGRFSDLNKSALQLQHWDKSIEAFKDNDFICCLSNFINYLNSTDFDNAIITNEEPFEAIVYEGSKKIVLSVKDNQLFVRCDLFNITSLDVSFTRRFLDFNLSLNYSKVAIENDLVFAHFCLPLAESSPYYLYYSLKEIATFSDSIDDYFDAEFEGITKIIDGITATPTLDDIVFIQGTFDYFKSVYNSLSEFDDTDKDYDRGLCVTYLSLLYATDYFTLPNGNLLNLLSEAVYIFEDPSTDFAYKRNLLKQRLDSLYSLDFEELRAEFYTSIRTFGVLTKPDLSLLSKFLSNEISSVNWYLSNSATIIAHCSLLYVPTYFLSNFSLPPYLSQVFKILIHVLTNDLHYAYNFDSLVNEDLSVKEDLVSYQFDQIVEDYRKEHNTPFPLDLSQIDYSNAYSFSISLLKVIQSL